MQVFISTIKIQLSSPAPDRAKTAVHVALAKQNLERRAARCGGWPYEEVDQLISAEAVSGLGFETRASICYRLPGIFPQPHGTMHSAC